MKLRSPQRRTRDPEQICCNTCMPMGTTQMTENKETDEEKYIYREERAQKEVKWARNKNVQNTQLSGPVIIIVIVIDRRNFSLYKHGTISPREKGKYQSVYMVIENVELAIECFHKHVRMGTARMKLSQTHRRRR